MESELEEEGHAAPRAPPAHVGFVQALLLAADLLPATSPLTTHHLPLITYHLPVTTHHLPLRRPSLRRARAATRVSPKSSSTAASTPSCAPTTSAWTGLKSPPRTPLSGARPLPLALSAASCGAPAVASSQVSLSPTYSTLHPQVDPSHPRSALRQRRAARAAVGPWRRDQCRRRQQVEYGAAARTQHTILP